MDDVIFHLNSYLIRQIETWAAMRGLTLDQAVNALLSRAMWNHRTGV